MLKPEDLRAYARRDWQAVEELKERFWVERKKEMTPLEALELADDLRRWLQQIRPDWPTPEDRAEDLARHIRLSEMLRSVRPESLRASRRG